MDAPLPPNPPDKPARSRRRLDRPLSPEEVEAAFPPDSKYRPILSLEEAAELAGLKPSTLKRKVSEGEFTGSVKRRKPLRFWRNRFVLQVMVF